MTETDLSRLYWAKRRKLEREVVGITPEQEPEAPKKWRGCNKDCFNCIYADCMDPRTDIDEFERRCLEIGHQGEVKWKKK